MKSNYEPIANILSSLPQRMVTLVRVRKGYGTGLCLPLISKVFATTYISTYDRRTTAKIVFWSPTVLTQLYVSIPTGHLTEFQHGTTFLILFLCIWTLSPSHVFLLSFHFLCSPISYTFLRFWPSVTFLCLSALEYNIIRKVVFRTRSTLSHYFHTKAENCSFSSYIFLISSHPEQASFSFPATFCLLRFSPFEFICSLGKCPFFSFQVCRLRRSWIIV
jgi:hypothetical protein